MEPQGPDTKPLSPAAIIEERHQFYLYWLLRLVPLEDRGTSLTPAASDSAGHRAIRVSRAGHPDVTLYFDRANRVARMVTVFATGSGPGAPQEIQLDGTTGADGVRWFRRLRIWRDGKPYFDLTLRRFQPLKALVDPLLEGPNAESSRGTDKR